jgi:hypothetical protein
MQASYRAIFTEMLLAQSAAIEAFAGAAARCAVLAGQQYRQGLTMLVGEMPLNSDTGVSAHPGNDDRLLGESSANLVDFGRAFASLPRVSMMIFLSRYNDLRGPRGVVRTNDPRS